MSALSMTGMIRNRMLASRTTAAIRQVNLRVHRALSALSGPPNPVNAAKKMPAGRNRHTIFNVLYHS
jgi:hypothetical protein